MRRKTMTTPLMHIRENSVLMRDRPLEIPVSGSIFFGESYSNKGQTALLFDAPSSQQQSKNHSVQ